MDHPLTVLSLAAGIGGLDLAVERALGPTRTVCYVEREAFAAAVLAQAMERGDLAPAPVATDLRAFDGRPWRGVVDLVAAGYPCQPFSQAGKRLGAADPRHLWPEVARIIREVEPGIIVLENVAGHLYLGAHEVVRELQDMGYRVGASLVEAHEVGTPHHRRRLFLVALADADCVGRDSIRAPKPAGVAGAHGDLADGCDPALADAERDGLERLDPSRPEARSADGCDPALVGQRVEPPPGRDDADGWREYLRRWPGLEPSLRRSAHDLPGRVDRLRALGNAVCPEQGARGIRLALEALEGDLR